MNKEKQVPNDVMQIREMLNLNTISMTASKLTEGFAVDQNKLPGKEKAGLESFLYDAPIMGCEINGND